MLLIVSFFVTCVGFISSLFYQRNHNFNFYEFEQLIFFQVVDSGYTNELLVRSALVFIIFGDISGVYVRRSLSLEFESFSSNTERK